MNHFYQEYEKEKYANIVPIELVFPNKCVWMQLISQLSMHMTAKQIDSLATDLKELSAHGKIAIA